jgi:large subunit ribosomal protein L25
MAAHTISLDLEERTVTGKAVRRLRTEGVVPAVIHDHGKESIVVAAPYMEMYKAFQAVGKNQPITLNTGKKHYTALIKHVTFDPKKHVLTHVVFNAVKANEKVTAEVPVHIKFAEGNESTPAERASLVVLHQLEVVEVEAFPKNLPEILEFDGEKLVEVGDQATVADLIVPQDVVVKAEPTAVLATVFEPSALQAANDAAGGDADENTEVDADQGAGGSDSDAETEPKDAKKD